MSWTGFWFRASGISTSTNEFKVLSFLVEVIPTDISWATFYCRFFTEYLLFGRNRARCSKLESPVLIKLCEYIILYVIVSFEFQYTYFIHIYIISPIYQKHRLQIASYSPGLKDIVDKCLEVKGGKPGKLVNIPEAQVKGLCSSARIVFLEQSVPWRWKTGTVGKAQRCKTSLWNWSIKKYLCVELPPWAFLNDLVQREGQIRFRHDRLGAKSGRNDFDWRHCWNWRRLWRFATWRTRVRGNGSTGSDHLNLKTSPHLTRWGCARAVSWFASPFWVWRLPTSSLSLMELGCWFIVTWVVIIGRVEKML